MKRKTRRKQTWK